MHKTLPAVLVGLLTLLVAGACVQFVRQPSLGTFADDSVSYLILAQAMSPWHAAAMHIAEAMPREAFYPPLYPLLLALAGAAGDVARAHVVSALLVAAWLPLVYALGTRWLSSRWAAAGAALTTALLPALWINARGILSEPLYGALLLACLLALEGAPRRNWLIALLLSALVLTRSAALVLIASYAAWALIRPGSAGSKLHAAAPALVAFFAYVAWVTIRPVGTSDDYLRIVAERSHSFADLQSILPSLLRQANAVAEAWIGSVLLFWVEGRPLRVALVGAMGVLALAGLALRLRAGKPDAWILAAYLATFLLWPFYDQMGRFLFPALPVLLLYAFYALGAGLRRLGRPAALGHALFVVVIASLTVPGLAFIYQRAQSQGPEAAMIDWYRTPDLAAARERAQVHLDLFADMESIRQLTPRGARVMWVAPSYVALLAGRRGVPAPSDALDPAEYRAAVRGSGAQYVFLSAYHPRDTMRDVAWKAGLAALRDREEVVHASPRSLLLKLDPARLSEGQL